MSKSKLRNCQFLSLFIEKQIRTTPSDKPPLTAQKKTPVQDKCSWLALTGFYIGIPIALIFSLEEFNLPQWCPHLNEAVLSQTLNWSNFYKRVPESLDKVPMARIGNGVHGEGGLGPRLEPHLVLHLDQLEPVQILKPSEGAHLVGQLTCQRSLLEFAHRPYSFRFPPRPTLIRLDYQ